MGIKEDKEKKVIQWLCGKVRFLENEVQRMHKIVSDHEDAICVLDRFAVDLAMLPQMPQQ